MTRRKATTLFIILFALPVLYLGSYVVIRQNSAIGIG